MSREADLYKDKIEVSLDGRQIFYLFFGGAVIIGLVFVLGVMVGRRVEARGHVDRARTTAAADPLAALDRLEGNGGLSFKGALMGDEKRAAPSDVEKAIGEIEKARAKPDAPKVEAPKVEPKIEAPKIDAPKPEAKKPEVKPDDAKVAKVEKSEVKVEKPKKPESEVKPETKLEAKPETKPETKPESKPEKKPEAVAEADKPKTEEAPKSPKYTLQLSSFQDKSEAEAFLSSIKASGYQAYVTEASVSGKGTFYRVRMGTYRSIEAANDAKAEFEKSSKKSASVMRL